MERSIDAARNRRIVDGSEPKGAAPAVEPAPAVRPAPLAPMAPTQPAMSADGTTPRLKARPKRSQPSPTDQHFGIRSRAS